MRLDIISTYYVSSYKSYEPDILLCRVQGICRAAPELTELARAGESLSETVDLLRWQVTLPKIQ